MLNAIICDIDGTLALKGERSPFDWQRVDEDAPNKTIVALVSALGNTGLQVILVSGRKEECRGKTLTWLWEHKIPFQHLFMRADDDNRPDNVLKKEIFEKHIKDHYEVFCVLDDRQKVVDMWRELGLTCLQVAPGDF